MVFTIWRVYCSTYLRAGKKCIIPDGEMMRTEEMGGRSDVHPSTLDVGEAFGTEVEEEEALLLGRYSM